MTKETSVVKLSKTSKLGAMSWSLQAGDTCPGSRAKDGSIVDACRACYAKGGAYRFRDTKASRAFNRDDWKREGWVQDMISALKGKQYFRWFDSGDVYALGLADKILQIMQGTPGTKHWLPTRMHKFQKFQTVLARMDALPNVMVRRSSDSVTGQASSDHGSVIIPSVQDAPEGSMVCMAYSRGGKCAGCRSCWDKSVKLIAYPIHGATGKKVVRLKLAT